jgi:transcription-repair coupling factor (superfamily II helicase)
LPDIAVNRRADIPTHALQRFLQDYAGRVLLLADSLGRREIMAEYLREYALTPALCENYAQFLTGNDHFMLAVGALQNGFMLQDEQLQLLQKVSCMPRSHAAELRAPQRKAMWKGCCATCPSSSRAIRWCMNSMASRVIMA